MGITGWFKTKCGVRQGSVLLQILFNVVMNEICLKMKEKTGDLKALEYADDVMIWGNKIKVLENKVNEWNNISKDFGLKINLDKTVMLKISRNKTRETMKLDWKDIKEVDTFTYLGSNINKNGKIQNEINERRKLQIFTIWSKV
jgi:hypothetical protein